MKKHQRYSIDIAGEHWELCVDKAAYWPREKSLMVADTHFGKDSTFQRHGIALPFGSLEDDLARLNQLLHDTNAQRLLVLGDFFHGPMSKHDPFWKTFNTWRRNIHNVEVIIIQGNHDKKADLTSHTGLDWVSQLDLGPFRFQHEPDTQAEKFSVAGHIHPFFRLKRGRSDSLRLPVFVVEPNQMILPAFGKLTGGFNVEATPGRKLYAAGPDRIIQVN